MRIFKQVDYTLNEKIVGKEGSPYVVEIQSKEFEEYKKMYNKDIFHNLKNFKGGNDFSNLPNNLDGHLVRRKKIIDVMNYTPYFFGLDIIVSEKFKNTIENLHIDNNEFCFKRIKIKNTGDDCYLLLVPYVDYIDLIFEKTIYRRKTYDEIFYKQYSSNEERLKDEDKYKYDIHKGYISEKYKNYDIINLRGGGLYFSERLITELIENNIIGLDIHSTNEVIISD